MVNSSQERFSLIFAELGIKLYCFFPYRPPGKGQVESSNKVLINIMKKRLEKAKEKWVVELFGVSWAMRKTPKLAIGEGPFSLVYDSEAIISSEIIQPTLKRKFSEENNYENQSINLLLLEERRERLGIKREVQKKCAEYFQQDCQTKKFPSQ